MKQVAIHADDFGLSNGTNQAIAELLDRSLIQSTTLLANGPAFEDAVTRYRRRSREWSVGLHVNLTQFAPCGEGLGLESMLGDTGFIGRRGLYFATARGRIKAAHLAREIEAQWQRCEASGIRPAHLDSHQHAHAIPQVAEAVYGFANRVNVPVRFLRFDVNLGNSLRRMKTHALNVLARRGRQRAGADELTSLLVASIFSTGATPGVDAYLQLIRATPAGRVELMVHPAIVDEAHRSATAISAVSQGDYEILRSDSWMAALQAEGVELVPAANLLSGSA